jgi:hypothetical protein
VRGVLDGRPIFAIEQYGESRRWPVERALLGNAGRKPAAANVPIPIDAIRLMDGYYIRYRRTLL